MQPQAKLTFIGKLFMKRAQARRPLQFALVCLVTASCVVQNAPFKLTPEQASHLAYAEQTIEERNLRETRQIRTLTLPNHLKVKLISDPEASKSAAAMSVGVGSVHAPSEHRGLAHYLEHVLFLGSQKYPGSGEYHRFISQNGGYFNAYTANEETNYHFDVNTSAFPEALDRFAQFFIAPSFNAEYLERERNAVDSEYRMRFENSMWRLNYLIRKEAESTHPVHVSFQGSNESLAHTTREDLMKFYNKYYTAPAMGLAIISSLSLDEQERLVREKFQAVADRKSADSSIPEKIYPTDSRPALVEFETRETTHSLVLHFDLSPTAQYWGEKPVELVATLLNYAGPGSLIETLKNKGWISSMMAWTDEDSFTTSIDVSFELNEPFGTHREELLSLFFSYIKAIQNEGLKSYVFQEQAEIAHNNYVYGSKAKDSSGAASLARALRLYGPELTEARQELYWNYNPELFNSLTSQITPERMLALYTGPDIKGTRSTPEYGIRFNRTDIRKESWFKKLSSVAPDKRFYPQQNPYLPVSTRILTGPSSQLTEVLKTEQGVHWHKTAVRFKEPKGAISVTVHTAKKIASPRERALSRVMVEALSHQLSAENFQALQAGYTFNISDIDVHGNFGLASVGYSDRLLTFFHSLLKQIKNVHFDEVAVQTAKLNNINQLTSIQRNYPMPQSTILLMNAMTPGSFGMEEVLAAIPSITTKDVQEFRDQVLQEIWVEAITYGNLTESRVSGLVPQLFAQWGSRPTPFDKRTPEKTIRLNPGAPLAVTAENEGINNVWRSEYQLGESNPNNIALVMLLNKFFESSFYEAMRTERSLGYVVGVMPDFDATTSGLLFAIQSDKPATQVGQIAVEWIRAYAKELANMPDGEFTQVKSALIEELRTKPETFADDSRLLINSLSMLFAGEDYQELVAAELEKLTKQEFAARTLEFFAPETEKRITAYVTSSKSKGAPPTETVVTNIPELHQKSSAFATDRWKALNENRR